ncbi:AraC family transcriptional regulator [Chitinophaga ginsengisegetis]|uniref:helix-turn-helix domain-containing protein n=1 Tax=Chitinophaga ginsengisegetis TaxID=393003 RepID=UPI000DB935EA|nr:response regulator transcription factor [Chitinophaga ginsengisegetis]MDR6571271.1 AraC-like DNA-binding protein [Chitinophaga ginsengisegetis]MDR6651005.1 AraC-like DNA-binding protein [Chitinophaga ginsengisegetis]MDR6657355.1 AraC-like DNA-binding protein [Chitinophaga ginsengisegetis]
MPNAKPYRIKSITEIHRLMGLPKPHHPLISILDLKGLKSDPDIHAVIFDLYVISMKRGCDNLFYGQQKYDFDEGLMAFMSPGQVLRGEENGVPPNLEGWMLFIHPDFLWNTSLATKIKKYEYFGYSTNEALFLSDKEEMVINDLVKNIRTEYHSNIDKFSQDIIISNLETLLNYAERFYQRQFITRKITNHKILDRFEEMVNEYLSNEALLSKGLPSVQYFADALNISSKYLSSLLKQLTGQTTRQIIHNKLIDKAKEKLSTTELSVSEIAYELGFEHPQSFNKLFKSKTRQSPLDFRQSFN